MAIRCEKGKDDAYLVTRSGRKITFSRKLLFDQVSPLHLLNLCLHICFVTHSAVDYSTALCSIVMKMYGVVLLQLQAHILF